MKKIWITWERHRRTRELALSLDNVELFEFQYEKNRHLRHMVLLVRSFFIILHVAPDLVIVQNPSVVLSLFAVCFSKITRKMIIIDAHNEGLKPFRKKLNILLPIYIFLQKMANITIVTNKRLALMVEKNSGKPFVLEDKIPTFNRPNKVKLKGKINIVSVCTFQKDEPYSEVIKSASFFNKEINIYITGRHHETHKNMIKSAPQNIVFTGFLNEADYINLLFSCDIVMDLTTMEDCLVCGAYEAISLEKPLILSDTVALREYFSRGAVFTSNRADEIAKAIKYGLSNIGRLRKEIIELKKDLLDSWQEKIEKLNGLINSRLNVGRA